MTYLKWEAIGSDEEAMEAVTSYLFIVPSHPIAYRDWGY